MASEEKFTKEPEGAMSKQESKYTPADAVAELKAARDAWHEDFGVPISAEYARFLEAIGRVCELAEARSLSAPAQPQTCAVCGRSWKGRDAPFSLWVCPSAWHLEAVSASQPSADGWLIEKGQLCLGSCSRKPAWVTFIDPSAIRFARKEDAENMLNSLRSMSDKDAFESCTVNDHMWG